MAVLVSRRIEPTRMKSGRSGTRTQLSCDRVLLSCDILSQAVELNRRPW